MKASAVVLMSGGPDSLITLRWVESHPSSSDVMPLYVDVGNRYGDSEWAALCRISRRTGEVFHAVQVLQSLGQWEDSDAHIFGRNAFLTMVAAKYLPKGGWIFLTVQKDELDIPDRTPEFLEHMGVLLSGLAKHPITVSSPWLSSDKTDMVKWYLDSGYSKQDLLDTTSCYKRLRGLLQCGDCPACIRRFIAFSLNGLEESYNIDPRKSETAKVYVDRAREGTYSLDRCQRILSAFGV